MNPFEDYNNNPDSFINGGGNQSSSNVNYFAEYNNQMSGNYNPFEDYNKSPDSFIREPERVITAEKIQKELKKKGLTLKDVQNDIEKEQHKSNLIKYFEQHKNDPADKQLKDPMMQEYFNTILPQIKKTEKPLSKKEQQDKEQFAEDVAVRQKMKEIINKSDPFTAFILKSKLKTMTPQEADFYSKQIVLGDMAFQKDRTEAKKTNPLADMPGGGLDVSRFNNKFMPIASMLGQNMSIPKETQKVLDVLDFINPATQYGAMVDPVLKVADVVTKKVAQPVINTTLFLGEYTNALQKNLVKGKQDPSSMQDHNTVLKNTLQSMGINQPGDLLSKNVSIKESLIRSNPKLAEDLNKPTFGGVSKGDVLEGAVRFITEMAVGDVLAGGVGAGVNVAKGIKSGIEAKKLNALQQGYSQFLIKANKPFTIVDDIIIDSPELLKYIDEGENVNFKNIRYEYVQQAVTKYLQEPINLSGMEKGFLREKGISTKSQVLRQTLVNEMANELGIDPADLIRSEVNSRVTGIGSKSDDYADLVKNAYYSAIYKNPDVVEELVSYVKKEVPKKVDNRPIEVQQKEKVTSKAKEKLTGQINKVTKEDVVETSNVKEPEVVNTKQPEEKIPEIKKVEEPKTSLNQRKFIPREQLPIAPEKAKGKYSFVDDKGKVKYQDQTMNDYIISEAKRLQALEKVETSLPKVQESNIPPAKSLQKLIDNLKAQREMRLWDKNELETYKQLHENVLKQTMQQLDDASAIKKVKELLGEEYKPYITNETPSKELNIPTSPKVKPYSAQEMLNMKNNKPVTYQETSSKIEQALASNKIGMQKVVDKPVSNKPQINRPIINNKYNNIAKDLNEGRITKDDFSKQVQKLSDEDDTYKWVKRDLEELRKKLRDMTKNDLGGLC